MQDQPHPDDEAGPTPRVLALIRRYGWNATAFQVLAPGFSYFFDDDACVAYLDTGRAWVAAGAPLCPLPRHAIVARAFLAAAARAGRRACFFATEQRFAHTAALPSLRIGEQPVWDPDAWPATLRGSRSLREQLRRARAKRVRVRRLSTAPGWGRDARAGAPMQPAIAALVERWLAGRRLAPMGFLVQVEPLDLRPDHALFVAEVGGPGADTDADAAAAPRSAAPALVGLLVAAPIPARAGWLVQHLLRAPDAPNGTTESLVDGAMRAAAADGRRLVTLGLAPLAGPVAPPLRLARGLGGAFYGFDGLRAFKAKLRPQRWDPIFLSFPAEVGAPRALADALAAFAGGDLLRFGLRTLWRRARPAASASPTAATVDRPPLRAPLPAALFPLAPAVD